MLLPRSVHAWIRWLCLKLRTCTELSSFVSYFSGSGSSGCSPRAFNYYYLRCFSFYWNPASSRCFIDRYRAHPSHQLLNFSYAFLYNENYLAGHRIGLASPEVIRSEREPCACSANSFRLEYSRNSFLNLSDQRKNALDTFGRSHWVGGSSLPGAHL